PRVRSSGRRGTDPLAHVAAAGAVRAPARGLMPTEAALRVTGLIVAIVVVVWAALLALAEEAAVGEALHTLGDAPPIAAERRVPLHRALHVARLALLVLGAVATANAVAWWSRPWAEALATLVVGTMLLFKIGRAHLNSSHRTISYA